MTPQTVLALPARAFRRARRELTQTRRAQERRFEDYRATHLVRKLNLGAGSGPIAGWLNTDVNVYHPEVTFLDAARHFPIPDESFDYVFAEHLIEHLSLDAALRMLRESHRILRSGGRIRLATPPLETLIALYQSRPETRTQEEKECMTWACLTWLPEAWLDSIIGVTRECLVLNAQFRNWGHQFLYDRASLEGLLRDAGFGNLKWYPMGESEDPELHGVERHGDVCGARDMVAKVTMCIEAGKP